MRANRIVSLTTAVVLTFVISAVPCGPSFLEPVFDTRRSPEFPYSEYAAGELGILKHTYHRSVLFAAYRYINGGGFNPTEQQALVSVWRAEFRKEGPDDSDVVGVVKQWIAKRAEVMVEEERVPVIYTEREYGGYDFFPNCAKNAFETAIETLSDRVFSHGSDDPFVKEWVNGQDSVFSNCSRGKTRPGDLQPGAPLWLQKDRDYQNAAAAFYSLDHEGAKRMFSEIALDHDSPWRETADYLVARTLIRQASMTRSEEEANELYRQAEEHLRGFVSVSGRFSGSAQRLMGLIAYRIHPEQRVRELAQVLSRQGSSDLRQDLIDFSWLLDKFEAESLRNEEKRIKELNASDRDDDDEEPPRTEPDAEFASWIRGESLRFWIRVADPTAPEDISSVSFSFPVESSDDEIRKQVEEKIGRSLTADEVATIAAARVESYMNKTGRHFREDYQGRYFGSVGRTLALVPEFLRYDDLTDWLFTFQLQDENAYRHSLVQFSQTGSELWLMTALSKANGRSPEAERLIEAAERVGRTSPAFLTVAYHRTRILLEMQRNDVARKVLDDILEFPSTMPASAENQFRDLRRGLAGSVDDFFRDSVKRPFTFAYDNMLGSLDELAAEQKSWYNPEYTEELPDEYRAAIDREFEKYRSRLGPGLLDSSTVGIMNYYFPTSVLFEAHNSPALPPHLKDRFAIAVWTRAILFDDFATASKIAPHVSDHYPELAEPMKFIETAQSAAARRDAALYLLIKNPVLTPFIEGGIGKTDNTADAWDSNDWWCVPYDEFYDPSANDMVSFASLPAPGFLTPAQIKAATDERNKLKSFGNASTYMAERVIEWAHRSPGDPRVPEALYLMYRANEWSKYGCGGDLELRKRLADTLIRQYPQSTWATRMLREDSSEN